MGRLVPIALGPFDRDRRTRSRGRYSRCPIFTGSALGSKGVLVGPPSISRGFGQLMLEDWLEGTGC